MIFDPVLTGETIKQCLKEHNMTQDQLANHLHITKSAVSQNLNGKSSFDIQNLIAIAKLFSVSLDFLLGLQKDESRIPSQYEKLIEKGLDGINHVPPKQLQLHIPDTYGSVFIEYVLSYNHMVLLNYILTNDITFVDPLYIRANQVTLKVLLYMMEHHIEGTKSIFDQYISIVGGLSFEDEVSEALFYGLLDQDIYHDFQQYILDILKADQRFLILKTKSKRLKLTLESFIDILSKHHLKNTSLLFLKQFDVEFLYVYILRASLKNKHYFLMEMLLDVTFTSKPNSFKITLYNLEEGMYILLDSNQEILIRKALDKHLYQDVTHVFNASLKHKQFLIAHYILENFKETLQLRKIQYALLIEEKALLLQVMQALSMNDKNYILSRCLPEDTSLMLYLIESGATFTAFDYIPKTFDSINAFIKYLINKEKK